MLSIGTNNRQIFTLLIFETHFPAVEKFRSGVDVRKFLVLIRSFQLSTNHIFETVVRDDMVMRALVLNGYSFLHQASLFEFVAVDERPAEAPLLVWAKALGEVGVYLVRRVRLGSIEGRVLILVVRVVDVISGFGDGRSGTFFSLSLSATRWVERRLLLLWLQCPYKLPVYQTVVHHSTWRPMHSISPALYARSILLVHKNSSGGEHLCALFVMGPAADVAKTSL